MFEAFPHTKNFEGHTRRAGFELELTGLDAGEVSAIIQDQIGGEITAHSPLHHEICNTQSGDYTVELDSAMVAKLAAQLEAARPSATAENQLANPASLLDMAGRFLTDAAGELVPLEVVTPPLEHDQFDQLESLRASLQQKHAQGTRAAWLNAFGMHINPDIYSDKVDETRDILRAFVLLYAWLKKELNIDPARRVLTFIDPFPASYLSVILQPDYAPNWEGLIGDYLHHNPTRNRALDLLPLFAYLHSDCLKTLDQTTQRQVKARPTYHYRLPNCDIDDPDWRIAHGWNSWVAIETLAKNKDKLRHMMERYHSVRSDPLHWISNRWIEETEAVLRDV